MLRPFRLLPVILVAFIGCNARGMLDDINSIHIIEGHHWTDGGTTALLANTDSGNECSIRVNQHIFNEYGNPGRLFFNNKIVDVRSEHETKIIQLLTHASFGPNHSEAGPQERMQYYCDQMIQYLESDHYVDIATNGLPEQR